MGAIMMKLKRLLAALMVFCLAVISVPAVAEETRYVSATWTNVYKKASTSSGRCGKLSFGESVTLIKDKSGWAKIRNEQGDVGFCKLSALKKKDPNTARKTLYALSAGVPVYRHALTSSKKLGTLAKGDAVIAVASTKDGKWRRIEYEGGHGYVRGSALSSTQPEMPTVMYIAANTAVIYKSASTSSKKLMLMNYGESLVRRKTSGSWAKVKTSAGVVGWIKKKTLTLDDPNGTEETWYVSKATAPVRVSPSSSSDRLATLTKDEPVSVVAETPDGEWKRVKYNTGYGFMRTDRLTSTPPNSGNPGYVDPYKGSASPTIERVAAIAVAQYGKPYVWGTEGPDTFDCSGLTFYAFKNGAGITLKRSAYEQGYDKTYQKITDVNQVKRGDIVCFDTVSADKDLSDHTGLYLGGGDFVHASSGQGKVVVSTLREGYYSRAFSWALRILP
jgi:cell wall-associated NlpC family hydrolase